ncbi:MAG: MFS transporter, partial [Candidatus Limnocylindrales bacterium]
HFQIIGLAWLVLQLTGSGLALGFVLMAAAIPRGILMLVGGAVSDRREPKSVIFATNALRAVVVGIIAVLVLTGRAELWHVAVMAVIFGTVDAFFYPAMSSFLPLLVRGEGLPAANALFQATGQLLLLVGPALAGLTVAIIGTGSAFALDSASFIFAAVAITLVRGGLRSALPASNGSATPDAEARPERAPAPASLMATIREGARYAFHDSGLRTMLLLSTALNFAFEGPISVGLPWLSANRFDAGSAGFGIMVSGFGAGALIGAVVAGSIRDLRHRGAIVLAMGAGLGLGLGAIGLAPGVAVVTVIGVFMGLGVGFINVVVVSWIQQRTDPSVLGRVMSIMMLGSVGLAPLSLVLTGALIDVAPTLVYLGAGAIILASAAVALISRADRALG